MTASSTVIVTLLLVSIQKEYGLADWEVLMPFFIYILFGLIRYTKAYRQALTLQRIKKKQAAVREKWRLRKIQKLKDRFNQFKNRIKKNVL